MLTIRECVDRLEIQQLMIDDSNTVDGKKV